jgi:hypothetical protein
MRRAAWLALLGLALPRLALGAAWLVDAGAPCPGQGTPAAPYCRVNTAAAKAQCGDILRLRASPTPYPAAVLKAPSCEGKAPMILEGELNQEPRWRGGLRLEDVSNWVVRGQTWSGGSGVALHVKARSRPVVGVQLLGNRVIDWQLDPALEVQAAILVEGNGGTVPVPIIGTRVRGNTILNFRGRGLSVIMSQGEQVEYNTVGFGQCARRRNPATGTVAGEVVGIKVTGWHHEAPVASFGGQYVHNHVHDLQGRESCRESLGVATASVHGLYCDVGPSDLLVVGNTLRQIGTGESLFETHGIRMESRCHRAQVLDNVVEDTGGTGVRVNGPNFDVLVAGNRVVRAGLACVEVREGFTQPTRPGLRRRVLRNTCLESEKPLVVSPEAQAEDPGLQVLGNSWQTEGGQ